MRKALYEMLEKIKLMMSLFYFTEAVILLMIVLFASYIENLEKKLNLIAF